MRPYRTTHTEKKFCPFCGKQNPTTNKYCDECGYEIPEISFFPQNNNTQPQSDREQNQPSQTIDHSSTVKKKRGYGWLIFFLALSALFIYTNPDEKMHLDFIRKSISAKIIDKSSPWGGTFSNLPKGGIGEATIDGYLNTYCKRTNYIFFSITEIQANEKWELFSIGILGNFIAWQDVKNNLDLHLNQLTQISYNYEGTYKTNGDALTPLGFRSAKVEKKENDIYVMSIDGGIINMKGRGKLEGNKLVFNIAGSTVEIIGDTFYFMGMEFTKIK